MIPELRNKFNAEFNPDTYEKFIAELNSTFIYPADFRISETPVFLPEDLKIKLIDACDDILGQVQNQIQDEDYIKRLDRFIPGELFVPNETDHPEFLQIDFAICKDSNGDLIPKLIELQGFPTVYAYQYYLDQLYRKYFNIDDELTPYFNNINSESYKKELRKTIIGNSDPVNVILLEIQPEKQKTRIDFAATEKLLGIKSVCISNVIQQGKKLFYKSDGKTIPIERIYNRVIFDELKRNDTKFGFNYRDQLDVKWLPHPNWFLKISKFSLPLLKGMCVPECYFLDEIDKLPEDLNQFVLKPLFSFAGLGVDIDLNDEKLKSISSPSNYILQKKIDYSPVIKTPDENSKIEIRMMFLWDKKPMLVNNLIRMSKGRMMGVDFNKNKTWVGSSLALHY
jgi:hypothetical protein